jgi:DNA invertase Pin-like site-specific DNA recombinase
MFHLTVVQKIYLLLHVVLRRASASSADRQWLAQRGSLLPGAAAGLHLLGAELLSADDLRVVAEHRDGKRSGVDAGRPELKRCLDYLREGDTLLVTKLDRLARSTSDLYRIVSQLAGKGVEVRVIDDPAIDTSSRTGKLVIAEFENDIRFERQMDGIAKARDRGVKFGRKPLLVADTIKKVRKLRKAGKTVPEIMRQTSLSKASIYRVSIAPYRRSPNIRLAPQSGRRATSMPQVWESSSLRTQVGACKPQVEE